MDEAAAFVKDHNVACVAQAGDTDWDGSGERYAWRVASVKALQTPIPDPRKTMTGLPVPTTLTVTFAAPQRCPSGVEPEVAPGTSAEYGLGECAESPAPSTATLAAYFEEQEGAWCGMHALNNYFGGPYVTQDACRRAARAAAMALSEGGLGVAEELQNHIDLDTGFLSIDVTNVLGAVVCSLCL